MVQSTFKVDDKANREPPYADENKHAGRRLSHESERERIEAEVRRLTYRLFGTYVAHVSLAWLFHVGPCVVDAMARSRGAASYLDVGNSKICSAVTVNISQNFS